MRRETELSAKAEGQSWSMVGSMTEQNRRALVDDCNCKSIEGMIRVQFGDKVFSADGDRAKTLVVVEKPLMFEEHTEAKI